MIIHDPALGRTLVEGTDYYMVGPLAVSTESCNRERGCCGLFDAKNRAHLPPSIRNKKPCHHCPVINPNNTPLTNHAP